MGKGFTFLTTPKSDAPDFPFALRACNAPICEDPEYRL